jgi:probable HAF family extracellular repeat protein
VAGEARGSARPRPDARDAFQARPDARDAFRPRPDAGVVKPVSGVDEVRGAVRPRSDADLDAAIARLAAPAQDLERPNRPWPDAGRPPARPKSPATGGRRKPRRGLKVAFAFAVVAALGVAGIVAVGEYRQSDGHPGASGAPAAPRPCLAGARAATGSSFLLDNGAYTMIKSPDAGSDTVATGISANGRIVGGYHGRDGKAHGFVLTNGAYTTVDAPGAKATTLIRVNDKGQMLGVYDDGGHACHSFLLKNGAFTAIRVAGAPTEALDFNDNGKIVGDYLGAGGKLHGFLMENGKVTTIDVSGALATGATSISNDNVVAGYYLDGQRKVHGYVRDHDGLITKVDAPGADRVTLPFAIAARSQTVGHFVDAGQAWHGFVTDTERYTMIDPPGVSTINQLFDITDTGKIVGFSGRPATDSTAASATGAPGCQSTAGDLPLSCLLVAALLNVWV